MTRPIHVSTIIEMITNLHFHLSFLPIGPNTDAPLAIVYTNDDDRSQDDIVIGFANHDGNMSETDREDLLGELELRMWKQFSICRSNNSHENSDLVTCPQDMVENYSLRKLAWTDKPHLPTFTIRPELAWIFREKTRVINPVLEAC